MAVLFKSVYTINYDRADIITKSIPDGFNQYIEDLIIYVSANNSIRQFKPRSQATQVVHGIKEIIRIDSQAISEIKTSSIQAQFEDIARRLLHVEVETQEQINKLGQKIKKGSLVQALLKNHETEECIFLVAKVEHSGYIDDEDFSFKSGFSSDQLKIWKSCIFNCEVNEDGAFIDTARIYLDRSARYWHDDFLELDEMINDEINTKIAFKHIESMLSRKVKPIAPSDYTILRNCIIGYMKTPQLIDYNSMLNSIFDEYQPTDLQESDLSDLKCKLLELPETKKFDRQFQSVPSAVNARIRKIYPVNDGIIIKIFDHIENLEETIKSIEEYDGARYIKIRTNNTETFKAFQR